MYNMYEVLLLNSPYFFMPRVDIPMFWYFSFHCIDFYVVYLYIVMCLIHVEKVFINKGS